MDKIKSLKILHDFYNIVEIGTYSYSMIAEKVEDKILKSEISYQYKEYTNVINKLNSEFLAYGEVPNNNANTGTKVMAWTGLQINTMIDKTSSHIAEMVIQGCNMGITKATKILNDNEDLDEDISVIINSFIQLQENNIDNLKAYL